MWPGKCKETILPEITRPRNATKWDCSPSKMSETDVATISPCLEELMAIGRVEGFTEGEAKERNLWATDKAETLLRILARNFGEVPSAIRDKLHTIHDFDALGQLTDVALDCQSLAEFEVALGK